MDNMIKTSSWHYRFHDSFNPEITRDLHLGRMTRCKYFWLTTFHVIMLCAATLLLGGIAVGATVIPIASILGSLGVIELSEDRILTGFVILGVELTFLFLMLNVHYNWTSKAQFSESNLLGQYLKDKKSKFCPILEVKDDV